MISLPLSLIGVMLALMFTGTTINIMSLIGVILLMGIVAKNAILLIDFAKWAREKDGLPRREALIEAGAIRLRPIMMTTLALIAGMIPVALGIGEGAEFRAPLGRAVIGGVITSTLLTLVVIRRSSEIWTSGESGYSPSSACTSAGLLNTRSAGSRAKAHGDKLEKLAPARGIGCSAVGACTRELVNTHSLHSSRIS